MRAVFRLSEAEMAARQPDGTYLFTLAGEER